MTAVATRALPRPFEFPIVGTDTYHDCPVSRDPESGQLYVLLATGIAAPTVASIVRWNQGRDCAA